MQINAHAEKVCKYFRLKEFRKISWFACSKQSVLALKKTKVKLDLVTDSDMLLMVEEGIGGGICHSIYRYEKANNK